MSDFVILLDNASAKIRSALSIIAQTVEASTVVNAHEGHEGGGEASITNPLPGLTGDAATIDRTIDGLERDQADLLDERRRLEQLLRVLPDAARADLLAQIADVDNQIADLQTQIGDQRVLLEAEFEVLHNTSISDLEAQLANIPNHPAFHIERFAIEQEINRRNELFAAGITEPYFLDELIDMSNSSDPLIRNTFQRVLDGDVTLLSFSEQEASLQDALAYDPGFDPRTEIAVRLPPDDRIRVYKRTVGGLSLGSTGFILLKDGRGESVLVHEVNHAVNAANNLDFVGEHTGDDREAIRSFTTEVRAYDVDNSFETKAGNTASTLESAHPNANRVNIILNDLGYDPAMLEGNQVHIAEAIADVTSGFPPPPATLSDDQIAQIERIYIADHILDHDPATNPVYDEAVERYDETETVRDTINEIILDGVGGNENNGPIEDTTS